MPIPQWDNGLGDIEADEYCAFNNITDFRVRVVKEIVEGLYPFGFRAYKIIVSECRRGDCQALYKKEHIIEQIDISDEIINNNI